MPDQSFTPLADWFTLLAQSLKLLANPLEPMRIQDILKTHLGARVARMLKHISDPSDTALWLNYVLRTDVLIRLWDNKDQPVIIACHLSSNIYNAEKNLSLITTPHFQAARHALGITHHWILLLPNFPMLTLKPSDLLDDLYEQLEQASEYAIIQL